MNEDIKIDHLYATNNQEILLIKEATINTMCVPIETQIIFFVANVHLKYVNVSFSFLVYKYTLFKKLKSLNKMAVTRTCLAYTILLFN